MVTSKSSGVNALSYSYIIINNKVIELEGLGKIRFDKLGTNIDVILKYKHRSKNFDAMFRRKLKWLQETHPEFML